MKPLKLKRILIAACLLPAFSCSDKTPQVPVKIIWEMGRNSVEGNAYENTFYIVNQSGHTLKDNWTIYFCQMPGAVLPSSDKALAVEQISSTYYKLYPGEEYSPLEKGDTLKYTFRCRNAIIKTSHAPEGAYMVTYDKNGTESKPVGIPVEAVAFTHDCQWSRTHTSEPPYPYGDLVFDQNLTAFRRVELKDTDIFPSVKSVQETSGMFVFTRNVDIEADAGSGLQGEINYLRQKLRERFGCTFDRGQENTTLIKFAFGNFSGAGNPERYSLTLKDNSVEIRASATPGFFYGIQTLLNIIGHAPLPFATQGVVIDDYPDLAYRGQMIDVARNFTKKEDMLKLIDILASYKINVLHIHLADDEGWRLEIPGIEELTSVGAHRGHTLDERDHLYPAYGSGWDPADTASLGSGFYSREDFVGILRYAADRHIKVIPEIDMPGHARAMIKSMEARYHRYIDTDEEKAAEYLLSDLSDTSEYLSAQSYTDNTICVALPSVYTFVRKVIGEIDNMYRDAGLKLGIMHLGGDEVPKGAWTGSDISKKFMAEKSMKEIRELKDYFVSETLKILNEKGIRMAGWQELALLPDQTCNPLFADADILSYCWSTAPERNNDQIPYKLANAGYPVIPCNVTNLYFDLAYNKHQDEPGLYWAGFVNELNSYNMLPFSIYKSVRNGRDGNPIDINKAAEGKVPIAKGSETRIRGIQGQLWSESIRSYDMVEYYLFPKMYGLVERAWNASPSWENDPYGKGYGEGVDLYYTKITERELPRLAEEGINFRLAQPGIKVADGKLYANSIYPGATIRYTTDGSEPGDSSLLWTGAVPCDTENVKAKVYYLGKESVTSILPKR